MLDSEARFRNFFEENGTVMFLVEPETGEFVYVNRAACEFYGYPREQLIGMFTRQISLSVPEEIARDRQRALRKECSCFYYSHRLANGEIREVELHSSPFEVNGRQMLYAIVNDITERKRAEQELRESSDFLNEAQRIGDLGCYVLDVSSGVWTSSRRLDEIFGIDETYEHSVAGWEALVHPADQAMMAAYFADEVIRDGRPFDKEYRIIRQTDQAERWVRGLGKLDFDELGKPLKMRGIISDVTAHKQWEMQLQDSEERYRTVFQTSPDGVLITRLSDGVIIDANQALLDAGRYERKDVIGRTTQELGIWVNDGDRQKLLDLLLQNGGYRNLEFSFKRKDGTTFWMRLSASLIEVEGCRCTLTFAQDISEAKAAAEALREGEERYRAAFQMNLDSIDICHLEDGKFVDVNDAFLHNLGFERDEVIGHTALELGIWENPADRQKMIELVRLNSFCRNIEVPYRTKDRLLRWGSLSVSTIEMNGVPSILSVTRDITDAKEAKDLLTAAAEALRLSEERYRTVFETSPDAVNISRLSDGVILDVNQSFLDSTGFTRNEVIGRTTKELGIWVNDSDRQRYFDSFTQNPSCRDLEVLSRRKNGEIFWMRLSAALIEVEGIPYRLVFAKEITEVKEAAEALRRSEERYRSVFETTPDAVIITRVSDGVILDVNQSFLDSAGFARNEVIGRTTRDLGIWVNDSDRLRFIDAMTRNPTCRDVEVLSRRSNDEVFWMRLSAALIEVDGIPCRLVFAKEITEVKAAAEALRRSEERYRTAFQTSIDAININRMDDGKYLDCNQAFLDVMGYEREEVIGKTSLQLGIWTDPHDRTNMTELLRQNGSCRGLEVQFRKKSGEHFWGVMSASAMEVDGVLCILSITRDLSEVKAAQNEIRSLAYYDPLTGLPNRRLLLERLRQTLVADGRDGRLGALLFVELDNFKMLNETIGHLNGDLLLMEVGRRIVTCAREADIVSRFGGDEFALMIEDLSEIAEEAAAQAKAVAEKIQESIALPFRAGGSRVHHYRQHRNYRLWERPGRRQRTDSGGRHRHISSHVGGPQHHSLFLSRLADRGERSRHAGGGSPPGDQGQAVPALLSAASGAGPLGGRRGPDPLAASKTRPGVARRVHSTGRGDGLDSAAGRLGSGRPPARSLPLWAGRKQSAHLMLAVNISALQFRQPGFVATVLSALERTGANPKKLKLELTESMLVDNIEEVIAKMSELKEHGVSFALDDFGTGYSSLGLPQAPASRPAQDRPGLCARHAGGCGQRRHCANHHFAGPRDGIVGDGRGRGERRAARLPRRSWLPYLPGIPVQPPLDAGAVRGAAADCRPSPTSFPIPCSLSPVLLTPPPCSSGGAHRRRESRR